jgi:exodeoxyribonuclease-5
MRLTEEQKRAIREILKFSKDEVTLGGRAGCGKTTVVQHLVQLLPKFAVCAYTGKATNVLRGKGVEKATTIHKLIYKPIVDQDKKVHFGLAAGIDYEGIIVDEASMVSKTIYEDLKSFGKPMVFVGDHGQLEPIGDDFNLMGEPDIRLETIHRNAGEIAHFAEYIRQGYRPSSWAVRNPGGVKVRFLPRGSHMSVAADVDQVICAYNKTRAEVNRRVREALGRGARPEKGDRVMCLRNNSTKSLFNGMQGTIHKLSKKSKMIFESDGETTEVAYDPAVFGQIKYEFNGDRDAPMPFDYSYCITGHKSQGSEFESVLVMEQKCDLWDHRRWAYTAASRAKNSLFWCES